MLRVMETQRDDPKGANGNSFSPSDLQAAVGGGSTGTLKQSKNQSNGSSNAGSSSSTSSAASSAAATANSNNTNSLQRQRCSAYQNFLLTEPRRNHREFALSLVHLSNIAKLSTSEEVYDEMHFQLLTTRRDVVNILLRLILLAVGTLMAYL